MKLHELKPAEGSRKVRNRVGRGTSSGNGKTSVAVKKVKKLVAVAAFALVLRWTNSIVPSSSKTWFLEHQPQRICDC